MNANLKLYESLHALDDMTEKQKRIVSAAIDVFSEKGYANSSTKEIAERAGVAEGNIFSHFHNKHGLLNAIINPTVELIFPLGLNDLLDTQSIHSGQNLSQYLTGFIRDRFAFVRDNSAVVKIFVAELFYHEDVRQLLAKSLPHNYWAQIKGQIKQLQQAHLLVSWKPQEILQVLASALGGAAVSYLYFKQPLSERTVQRTVSDLVKLLAP